MQSPEIYVRQIRSGNEDDVFLSLAVPFLDDSKDRISQYRLKQIFNGSNGTPFAVYEIDHNILAVQFYLGDKLLTFGDNETVQFMSVDEIRLVIELGRIAIDGAQYLVENESFHIIDGATDCQHMIVFDLIQKNS